MRIEHFALQVPDPVAMAEWYVKNLGFSIAKSAGEPLPARFLLSSDEAVMLEIYRNSSVAVPDYSSIDPLLLHLAFVSTSLKSDRDRLVEAGARVVQDIATTPLGDELVMLRDPWHIPIQLVRRAKPMLR